MAGTIWAPRLPPRRRRHLLFVELSRIAELQVVLEGIPLPAERSEFLEYAAQQGATPLQIGLLHRLPEREFDTIDEVAETLVRVQPEQGQEVPHTPDEESGAPPGGEAYTKANPESGQVRDLDAVSGG
jgi:uncharacterized protein DUF2795